MQMSKIISILLSLNIEYWQDLNVFFQVCVCLADRKTKIMKMAALASNWPGYLRLLLCNSITEFNLNLV